MGWAQVTPFFAPLKPYLWLGGALALVLAFAVTYEAGRSDGKAGVQARWDLQKAQDILAQGEERLRALDVGLANTSAAEQFFKGRQDAKTPNPTRARAASRTLAAVLTSLPEPAHQCPNQSVPTGPTPGSYDAADPRWQLERGSISPD